MDEKPRTIPYATPTADEAIMGDQPTRGAMYFAFGWMFLASTLISLVATGVVGRMVLALISQKLLRQNEGIDMIFAAGLLTYICIIVTFLIARRIRFHTIQRALILGFILGFAGPAGCNLLDFVFRLLAYLL